MMTARVDRPSDRADFQIGIITALDLETESVIKHFDKSFDTNGYTYGKHALDDNSYSTGQILGKPVVLCQLASMGKLEASTTAQDMRLSFENIRVLLLVGVAAGNPWISDNQPILLGDVVLSTHVIEMDYGRLYPHGIELRRGVDHELTKSDRRVRNFLVRLREPSKKMWLASKVDEGTSLDVFPGQDLDILYDSNYIHKHRIQSCDVCQNSEDQNDETCDLAKVSSCQELQCSTLNSADNERRSLTRPSIGPESQVRKCQVHFGTVASGSSVIKSALHRDQFSKSTPGIVAYENGGSWHLGEISYDRGQRNMRLCRYPQEQEMATVCGC